MYNIGMQSAVQTLRLHPDFAAQTLADALDGDLDFRGTEGKFCSHGWHPFPAKFPPQLPALFIEKFTEFGDTVLDPMAGSGTTLIEAARLGRRAIGCDIDPLALTVAGAKLSPADPAKIIQTGFGVLESAKRRYEKNRNALQRDRETRFDAATSAFIDYWFYPETQMELLALIQEIEAMRDAKLRRYFFMIFSSVIIAKSAGVSRARDLAHTRPHRVDDKAPPSAFSEFLKRLAHTIKAGGNANIRGDAVLKQAYAQNTGLPAGVADLIVTSPPYANNAIDYMRAHKFSLVWFNHAIKDLTALRSRYIGHDASGKNGGKCELLPAQCENAVRALHALSASKAGALRRYFSEIRDVIREMHRLLKPGKPCIVAVSSSVLAGLDVETHKGLAAIGQAERFELAGIGVRHINRDRRMMPARWSKAPLTQIENRMHDEYIIGLVKR